MSGVDLVTFINARLDEMAEDARQLTEALAGSIPSSAPFALAVGMTVSDAIAQRYNLMSRYRMDPQSVLADVAAKRRIVDLCAHNLEFEDYGWSVAEPVLKLLAAPFAQHPDYDPAWAVEGTVTT